MKSPRFLAALAMAAVLTTGVTTHASDFSIDTGNAGTGQQSTQTAIKKQVGPVGAPVGVDKATGEISVNGTFNKVITNLPTPDQEGRYLRITMPIEMNYVYDLDTHQMQSANALIQNQSVLVTATQQVDEQPVKMRFVGIQETNNTSQNSAKFEFVKKLNPSDKGAVQLPFTLQVNGAATGVGNYDLADIKTNHSTLPALTIQPGSNINLTLDLVKGQTVGNPNLIDQAVTLTNHALKLEFEYVGQ